MPSSRRADRQTGGCDYIICSHLICTSHCGSQRSTGVADRLEGSVCVYSFEAVFRAALVTRVVLTAVHKTSVSLRTVSVLCVQLLTRCAAWNSVRNGL
jgi:hypothetical protein